MQSTVTSQLPGNLKAKGLNQRQPATGRLQAVRLHNGRFGPPKDGWSTTVPYDIVVDDTSAPADAPPDWATEGPDSSVQVLTTYVFQADFGLRTHPLSSLGG